MTLVEIRETIEQADVTLDGSGFAIVQKQINLKPNQLNSILKVDFFQDALPGYISPNPLYIELIVTPFPVIFSTMDFATPLNYKARGPMAGSDTILFKSIVGPYEGIPPLNFPPFRQFPNESVGATPTFSFYTPMVYVTALLHGDPTVEVSNLAFSVYLALDTKKANLTSYGLGVMRERSVAQGILLMNQGRTINPQRNVGQTFPMWRYGGIRPERMIDGSTGRPDFFLPFNPNEFEQMSSTDSIRQYVRLGRTMVNFDEAFGVEDPVKGGIPDWVRFNLSRGLVAGPVLAQMPPVRYADNGNTIML